MNNKSLSVCLKKWRLSQKMGFVDASRKIGISQSTLFNYEDRLTTPSYRTAEKLGKVLNLSAVEIIEMSKFDMSMKASE
ncbi:helix-turn-helix transcriptional regulator [Weissella coleopterorum]|uniref:Helix-turn-helix transcriptional regulator n=1 Tax=Weissella coleopterorum TaxID=2714949 RepID=A0A6G8AXZ7_9LACO|nr:helix-turn-helix transcriptional regulator [Weissella coleopterorum]QIL49938.1 helix-turn-helix transcriptional regulator [Weissella coleopterorum]